MTVPRQPGSSAANSNHLAPHDMVACQVSGAASTRRDELGTQLLSCHGNVERGRGRFCMGFADPDSAPPPLLTGALENQVLRAVSQ